MNIKQFVKDSLSDMSNEELLKKYNLKTKKDISLILSSKAGQEEITKQQKPLTKEEKENLKNIEECLNKCLGVLK